MGIFDRRKKKKANQNVTQSQIQALLSIPCYYDGYDMVFEENKTNPEVYAKINALITNGQFDIESVEEYKSLTKASTVYDFYTFYESWTEYLWDNGFVYRLDNSDSIETFAEGINTMLKVNRYGVCLDKTGIAAAYRGALEKMGLDTETNYDILIADVMADELRQVDLELIALFDGTDNRKRMEK